MKKMKKFAALLLAVSMAAGMVACGSSDKKEETTKKEETKKDDKETKKLEGTLKVVTTGDAYQPLFDKFTEEVGPKVEFISMSSGEVLSKLKAEGGTPAADLWFGGGIDAFMDAKDNNLLEKVDFDAADDLAPSETIQLDRETVLAFVTRHGSTNSHTAILARTMNIPALVSTAVPKEVNGKMAIVDGFKGIVIIDPDEETLREYEKKQQDEKNRQELLQQLKGKPTVTKEGKEIKLYANIGEVKDLGAVLQNDAAGIGLFRSEFLYLQSDHFPTEDEQFQSYKTVAEVMAGKKVIIRTLDIGADKQIDYFGLEHEDNPALGYRAVRICLDQPDIFKTQLRALLRASMFGNISIMIPMIASVWEVRKVKEIMEEVKAELTSEGIPFKNVEFGIMIETPAAVMIADELAKEVDFFSIGTNDLTQYTLAIDRQNAKLDQFYDSHHPAVLKMIQMVIDSAHKAGIWAGICGELGADLTLTETFVKMGIDELSVSPAMVLPVRDKILNA